MTKEILIVGDLHGGWGHLNKLITKKKPKIVLQCGDFGWWPHMEVKRPPIYSIKNRWVLKGIKPGDSKVYWCDGNHEDHASLIAMGEGEEIECYPSIYYKPRGTTMELSDGRIVLFAGGGESIDKQWRREGIDWFKEELPSVKECDKMLSHPRIDIVISHTCPTEWVPDVCRGEKLGDPTREVLQAVLEKYEPSLWYHGHWHYETKGIRKGVSRDTQWYSLDYPGHGGWWKWLD